ncbi:MAG: glycoside hydrolase family 92 protein [Prevotella sp.]|nr:glycoside hydrolase family 92 protein [Prevotella sp.]
MPHVKMQLSNGHFIDVTTSNWSPRNVYVKQLELNGRPYTKSYLTWDDLKNGARLHFVMSNRPNTKRGTLPADVPPSLSAPAQNQ